MKQKYLVKLKAQPSTQDIEALEAAGAKIKRRYKHIKAVALELEESEVGKLLANPNVIAVEIDGEVHALDEYDSSWGVAQIGSKIVHEQGIRGQAVKVAVIDTGIDYTHPELSGRYRGGYDFVNDDNDPRDDHGHGTHCAGILAAALNGVGVCGVAPEVELYALKVLNATGSGAWSAVIAALDWCIDNGIQITSNSYGGPSSSTLMSEAFKAAWQAGILSIAAAGNSAGGENIDSVIYPAKYEWVVAVAATDISKARASFSSTGPTVEVSAPGVDIYSTLPGNSYGSKSGTSMACPHVAGLAALIKSAHPYANNEAVRGQIRASAEDLGLPGHDWLYGFGLINAPLACGDMIPNPPPMPPFTPPILLHEMATYPPSDIASDYAVLEGELLTLGNMTSVAVNFFYGKNTPPVTYLKPTPTKTMTAPSRYSYTITGLSPNTEYVVAAVGLSNTGQYVFGNKVFFTTKEAPVPPPPPSPVPMWVKSIGFAVKGKNLTIAIEVINSNLTPLAKALIKAEVKRDGALFLSYSGYTNGKGILTTRLQKPISATYVVTITSLTLSGYLWDKTKGVISAGYTYASQQSCRLIEFITTHFSSRKKK